MCMLVCIWETHLRLARCLWHVSHAECTAKHHRPLHIRMRGPCTHARLVERLLNTATVDRRDDDTTCHGKCSCLAVLATLDLHQLLNANAWHMLVIFSGKQVLYRCAPPVIYEDSSCGHCDNRYQNCD